MNFRPRTVSVKIKNFPRLKLTNRWPDCFCWGCFCGIGNVPYVVLLGVHLLAFTLILVPALFADFNAFRSQILYVFVVGESHPIMFQAYCWICALG